MAMLNDDGPEDAAEYADCAQGGFVFSWVEPGPAGFNRIDLLQHGRSSPRQQIYSKHRVDFALAFMSEVSPERRNAANFPTLLPLSMALSCWTRFGLANLNGSI